MNTCGGQRKEIEKHTEAGLPTPRFAVGASDPISLLQHLYFLLFSIYLSILNPEMSFKILRNQSTKLSFKYFGKTHFISIYIILLSFLRICFCFSEENSDYNLKNIKLIHIYWWLEIYVHDDLRGRLPESKYYLMNHHYILRESLLQTKNLTCLLLPSLFRAEELCPQSGVSLPSEPGASHFCRAIQVPFRFPSTWGQYCAPDRCSPLVFVTSKC